MKITISQENSSPIEIEIQDNALSPVVKSQEGVVGAFLLGTVLFPFVLAAICMIVLKITDMKTVKDFKKFSKHNQEIIKQITQILTDELNKTVKYKEPLKAEAKKIADTINKMDKFYDFKPANDGSFDAAFDMKSIVDQNFIIDVIKLAKQKSGVQSIDSHNIDMVYTGYNDDAINFDEFDASKSNDGWGGYYDKAMKKTSSMLEALKNKYPIKSTEVYIAGDDFGGTGSITFELRLNLTNVHKLLKEIDISDLKTKIF